MTKRLYAVLFIAVVLVLVLLGCSSSERDGADQVGLIPSTANMIGHVDLTQVVGDADVAGIYAALPREDGDPESIEEAIAELTELSGVDLRDFDEAWIFGDMWQLGDGADYAGAILRDGFEQSSLLADVESAVGETLVIVEHQGHSIYTWNGQENGLAFLSGDLLVAGSMQAVKDVIAVNEGSMPGVNGALLKRYDALDKGLMRLAAAVPEGLIEGKLEEYFNGDSSLPALPALADLQVFGMTMTKNGGGVDWDSQLCFSNGETANDVKGFLPLAALMIGSMDLPGGSVIQNPEKVLALLPELLSRSEFSTSGSCLTISSDLTAEDIEAMSAEAGPSGLGIEMAVSMGGLTPGGLGLTIDATVKNHIGMKFEIGDMTLAAASKQGPTYIEDHVSGNVIPANSDAKFQHEIIIPMNLVGERDLVISMETTAKARGMTMPLSASVELNTPGIESLITVPEIDLAVDFGELTPEGLHMGLQANLVNHNLFGLSLGDLEITAADQSGNVILTSGMKGCSVGPLAAGALSGDLLMPLETINEPGITISARTQAGFAGIMLPISARVAVNMPEIENLVSVPDIDLGVTLGEITPAGLLMGLEATLNNSNPFGIDVGDLEILAEGQSGSVLYSGAMDGCSVGPASAGALSADLVLPLEAINEPSIVIAVKSQAGFAGVMLPINARVTLNMLDIENITVPAIDMGVDFGELTSDGLILGLETAISNSNPFGIDVGDLLITAKGQSGNVIMTSNMEGLSLGPESAGTISGELVLPLEALSESSVAIAVQTEAGFAGLMLPIGAKVTVQMPDIESMFAMPGIELYTEPKLVSGFPLPGLHVAVACKITNNADFDLEVGDNLMALFDSDAKLVKRMTIWGGTVAAHCSRTFSGCMTLCASEYLRLISGDYFRVEVTSEAGIAGMDARLPIEAAMTMMLSSLFEVPDIDLGVDFGHLTAEGLDMDLWTTIANHNPFDIEVDDLLMEIRDLSGNVLFSGSMSGCLIGPDSAETLAADLVLPLEILRERAIVIAVQSQAGFGSVTPPINARMTINTPDLASLFAIPEIDLGVAFGELTDDGLHMGLLAEIANPNPFGINLGDLLLTATGQSGNVLFSGSTPGCSIGPESTGELLADLLLPLEGLDESTILLTLQSQAGFAGLNLPVTARMTLVNMPDIESLVTLPDIDLGAAFGELTPEGLHLALQVTITNPNPFGVEVGDLQVVARGQSGNVLFTGSIDGCSIGADSTETLLADLLLPLDVLDEPSIIIGVQSQAGFAGVVLPLSTEIALIVPEFGGGGV
jgi:LEA14-like dessication related protein